MTFITILEIWKVSQNLHGVQNYQKIIIKNNENTRSNGSKPKR